MTRGISVLACMMVALASLRMGLGLPAFGFWIGYPDWLHFAGAALWLGAAIAVALPKD